MANTIKDYTAALKRLNWAYAMAEKFDELEEDTKLEVYDIISQYEDEGTIRI
jgi:hypothetical protein